MLRRILTSDKKELTLVLPDDLVGKVLEVLAFAVEEVKTKPETGSEKQTIKGFEDAIKGYTINSGGYKFDRNEANDYE